MDRHRRRSAQKQLARFPARDRNRIAAAIQAMAEEPFAGDIIKLEGGNNRWRRRLGSYRVFLPLTPLRGRWQSARLSAALQPRIKEDAYFGLAFCGARWRTLRSSIQ